MPNCTVLPDAKADPCNDKVTAGLPAVTEFGVMLLSMSVAGVTVRGRAVVVVPLSCTVTLIVPGVRISVVNTTVVT